MNGIHDMGGMQGFGRIKIEANEPVFHAEWEGRARAMANLVYSRGYTNLDAFRFAIEQMEPSAYLDTPYFGRWLHATERCLIAGGIITQAEIDARIEEIQDRRYIPQTSELKPEFSLPSLREEVEVVSRFEPGNRVRVHNAHVAGHTRSPRYLRGKCGVIRRINGHEVFPDTNASHLGDQPQVVYSVTFDAAEIWGDSADPAQLLSIDLWDSYLESA